MTENVLPTKSERLVPDLLAGFSCLIVSVAAATSPIDADRSSKHQLNGACTEGQYGSVRK